MRTRQFNFEVDVGDDFGELRVNPDEHEQFAWYSMQSVHRSRATGAVLNVLFDWYEAELTDEARLQMIGQFSVSALIADQTRQAVLVLRREDDDSAAGFAESRVVLFFTKI